MYLGSPGAGFANEEVPAPLVRELEPHMQDGMRPIRKTNRKGLCVIVDFADVRLEDWHGPGINDISELSDGLRKMEDHWKWLSRGQEVFTWDIIRVTLPANLGPDAYSSWWEFRNAVADLAKQQVDISKYDANQDGVVDTAWYVISTAGHSYPYMIGGSSMNNGVNNFVDGQNSLSLIVGATGNFNHEVGHTIGLPDMYGPYGTLSYLTLMADSWPVPPQDFAAYERSVLGWIKPRQIKQSKKNIKLSAACKTRPVLRVSTPRKNEYFLIEYRRKPVKGYGSVAPSYNGLAVYHIFEGSTQQNDPPLVKLEAADGYIAPNTSPDKRDFLYPGNPDMRQPFVVKSYYGGNEVFEIDNLRWAGNGSLVFDITLSKADASQTNLLPNSSFEQGDSYFPDVWQADAFEASARFTWDNEVAKDGGYSVGISAATPNDARWVQTVSNLTAGKSYEFCGWIRGRDVITGPAAAVGANVSLLGEFTLSRSLSGSFDWTHACVTFTASSSEATLACRLGFYGSTVTGQVWCDSMSLQEVESAF
jgi:M6 family metalloprotease-like protein